MKKWHARLRMSFFFCNFAADFENNTDKQSIIYMKVKVSNVNQPAWKECNIHATLPANLSKLQELAYNLWWTWNGDAKDIFRYIDNEANNIYKSWRIFGNAYAEVVPIENLTIENFTVAGEKLTHEYFGNPAKYITSFKIDGIEKDY